MLESQGVFPSKKVKSRTIWSGMPALREESCTGTGQVIILTFRKKVAAVRVLFLIGARGELWRRGGVVQSGLNQQLSYRSA
jgi:hypothetical protein